MFGFFKRNFGGFDIVKKMAAHGNLDYRVYGSALTDQKVNFAYLRKDYEEMRNAGLSEEQALDRLIFATLTEATLGLNEMEERFGNQPKLVQTIAALDRFVRSRQ